MPSVAIAGALPSARSVSSVDDWSGCSGGGRSSIHPTGDLVARPDRRNLPAHLLFAPPLMMARDLIPF